MLINERFNGLHTQTVLPTFNEDALHESIEA